VFDISMRKVVLLATVVAMLLVRSSAFMWRNPLYRNLRCHSATSPVVNPTLPIVINTENVPVYLFSSQEVEDAALEQLKSLARSVIPVGFVSAMPDVHLGAGATIGSVFASEKYVSPNSVGVDIGCGMIAIPLLDLHNNGLDEATKHRIHSEIKVAIPTGFNQHPTPSREAAKTIEIINSEFTPTKWLKENLLSGSTREKTLCQLGTLGGGNHFIEVVYDESGGVWLMLHSGSRYAGKTTAEHYNKVALAQMTKTGVKDYPKDLFYLRVESKEGQDYLNDMRWCQLYAYYNREFMLDKLIKVVGNITGKKPDESKRINAHHNFCELTDCAYTDPKTGETVSKKLWVTRKGATAARQGQFGIIPGSMGVGSYIVRGLGNNLSWQSCSHGAGRLMSRTAAKKVLKQEDFQRQMSGIVYDADVPELIDEAPMAYKNLDNVMSDQKSLVEVVHRLLPLVNVKGFDQSSWKDKKLARRLAKMSE
jgi:tRNA-splicing ligase RtcB